MTNPRDMFFEEQMTRMGIQLESDEEARDTVIDELEVVPEGMIDEFLQQRTDRLEKDSQRTDRLERESNSGTVPSLPNL